MSTEFLKDDENILVVVFFSVPKSLELLQLAPTETTFPGVTRNTGANDVQVQTIGPILQSPML